MVFAQVERGSVSNSAQVQPNALADFLSSWIEAKRFFEKKNTFERRVPAALLKETLEVVAGEKKLYIESNPEIQVDAISLSDLKNKIPDFFTLEEKK